MTDPCRVGVHITYWGRNLNTPGHPERLLHSNPTSESPQISAQSSSGFSGGPPPGSTGFLDSRSCSRPPTYRSPSVERSRSTKAPRWDVSSHVTTDWSSWSCNHAAPARPFCWQLPSEGAVKGSLAWKWSSPAEVGTVRGLFSYHMWNTLKDRPVCVAL